MALRIGVIGAGLIGQDHIRRITHMLSGSEVVAVADANGDLAAKVASGLRKATVHATADGLISDANLDAVLVCSQDLAHEGQVLAAIAAGKPVFCEKPLATMAEACRRRPAVDRSRRRCGRGGAPAWADALLGGSGQVPADTGQPTGTERLVRLDSSAAPTTFIIRVAVTKSVSIGVPSWTWRRNSWISAVKASA